MKLCYFILAIILFTSNVTLKILRRQHHRRVTTIHYPVQLGDNISVLPNNSQFNHTEVLDKKSENRGLLARKLPPPLRKAVILTFEKEGIPEFVYLCLHKGPCSKDQVIHGVGRKSWKYRVRHQRSIMHFWQIYECYTYHRPLSCPVNGQWSSWGPWSDCSAPCGSGFKTRTRTCTNPAPRNYGKSCTGSAIDRDSCRKQCPKNFIELAGDDPLRLKALDKMLEIETKYKSLSDVCSKDHCTFHDIHELIPDGDLVDQYWLSVHCIERYIGCSIDGGWSDWHPWSNCTTECGIGDRFRIRRCNDPPPSNGGAPCEGEPFERENCLGLSCGAKDVEYTSDEIQAMWTEWSDWSKCSAEDCITFGTELSKRLCIGVKMRAICDIGNGTMQETLERRRPCVKEHCFKKRIINENEEALYPRRRNSFRNRSQRRHRRKLRQS